jgi:uncharacterized protein YecT (DUF1311 family)
MRYALAGLHCFVLASVLMLAVIAPSPASDDEFNRAESLKSAPALCIADSPMRSAICDAPAFAASIKAVQAAEISAIARARPVTVPLLKRDQVWFRDTIESYNENAPIDDAEVKERIAAILRQRVVVLNGIAQGFGRAGIGGRWANVFGSVEIAPADDGTFRVTLSTEALYGPEDVQRQTCNATALVRPGADGWLAGDADAPATANPGDANKPSRVKIRLQGETLRVVAGDGNKPDNDGLNCSGSNQLTGSYFPFGARGIAPAGHAAATTFVAPTFDCAHPATASDEEICADPDLAANDVRINRAWKRLLPRLDEATRRLLIEDQRGWVTSQAIRYPDQLHPSSDKLTYFVHSTARAHDNLADLQRERIALLEGFDEKRRGFEGEWRGYNAQLTVTRDKDGTLKADGNKWFEDDYKGGCDYEFSGKADGDVFHPKDKSKNPDMLERDHASLIVNRADDEWAKRRDNPATRDAEEGKCKRNVTISSTARLFPVKPSPDLDGIRGIR